MTESSIISRVRAIIDDVAVSSDNFTSETDSALSEFISLALSLLEADEGIDAPYMAQTYTSNDTYYSRPDGMYYYSIAIPSTSRRLVSLKFGTWKRSVTKFLPADDPLRAAQFSSVSGVGNGLYSPVAFLVGGSNVEAHALDTSSDSYQLVYVPALTLSNLYDKYEGALCYYTAALYHQSVNEQEAAAKELAIAKSMIYNEKKKENRE